MTGNTVALGQLAARVMEDIEALFGEDARIRTAMILYEVDPDNGAETLLDSASSDDRLWIQQSFVNEIWEMLEDRRRAALERYDDE